MKGNAKVVLRKTTYIKLAVLLCLAFLPGCAVVGPLLSIGGMAGLAPLQYASTAYTVGEFSYEYAVNENDPGEVIEAKIDSVLSGEAFMLPESIPGAKELNNGTFMLAEAEQSESAEIAVVEEPATPALSAEARRKRIEQILNRRDKQFERLELRRMAFLQAQNDDELSLRQTAMVSSPDLFQGAVDETRLR